MLFSHLFQKYIQLSWACFPLKKKKKSQCNRMTLIFQSLKPFQWKKKKKFPPRNFSVSTCMNIWTELFTSNKLKPPELFLFSRFNKCFSNRLPYERFRKRHKSYIITLCALLPLSPGRTLYSPNPHYLRLAKYLFYLLFCRLQI